MRNSRCKMRPHSYTVEVPLAALRCESQREDHSPSGNEVRRVISGRGRKVGQCNSGALLVCGRDAKCSRDRLW